MSVWYDHDVTVLGKKPAIAKFLGLDPETDVRVDRFDFSFGGKNGAGLRLGKIVEQNPDLIFLVKESIESDTVSYWLERFNPEASKIEYILIQDFGSVENKLSKKMLEEYGNEYSGLPLKHLNHQKGYEGFRWTMFLNRFDEVADKLKRADEYKETVDPYKLLDIKMYSIEYELSGDEAPRYVYRERPVPVGKANSMLERLTEDSGIINANLREIPRK